MEEQARLKSSSDHYRANITRLPCKSASMQVVGIGVEVMANVNGWRLQAEKAEESAQLTKKTAKRLARTFETYALCRKRICMAGGIHCCEASCRSP